MLGIKRRGYVKKIAKRDDFDTTYGNFFSFKILTNPKENGIIHDYNVVNKRKAT
jgi:hypothetical protein